MKKLIVLSLLLIVSTTGYCQPPEVWGIAKSRTNTSNYIIYKTDTNLTGSVTTVKVLASAADGVPNGNLVRGMYDSLIYGVTNLSSTSRIFQINTVTNTYSVKLQTTSTQGYNISGELVKHPNGKYYGVARYGGSGNTGGIFEWNPSTNAYSLRPISGLAVSENSSLRYCSLDGYFYGLAELGGSLNYGSLFRYNPTTNTFQVLHEFTYSEGIYPRGSVQILEHANGDFNLLYTLRNGNTNNYGTLCNTIYTSSSNTFNTVYHSFNGLYFYNNAKQYYNPAGDLILLKNKNSNNDSQYMGIASVSTSQNLQQFYSFAINKTTKQLYTNTTYNFTNSFPTHTTLWNADNMALGSNGTIYIATNGNTFNDPNGAFIRKYTPFAANFSQSKDIYTSQNLSNDVMGGRVYVNTYSTCIVATTPTISGTCNSGMVTLSITSGTLNNAAAWKWYDVNGCGVNPVGTGTTIALFAISGPTTYYARGEGGCTTNGNCGSVVVNCGSCTPASTPTLSSSSSNVCNNNPVTLSINSGSLNDNVFWTWYKGSCSGTAIGTGTSITVNQNATTTYYVRGEGGCSTNGTCGSITVNCSTCTPASTPTLSSSSSNVCNNNAVTLSISAGSLNASAAWKWYKGSCGGTLIGTGSSITVNQSATTTYYARGEGGCSTNGSCGSITVSCNQGGTGTDLFFSEYIEGSSNNKVLEIFNPTAASVDLSIYKIELYANGGTTVTNTQTLSGNLASGDVYIIANATAGTQFLSVADITSNVCNFNGNDAIVLKKNNVAIDIIGVVGVDPGTNWIVGGGGATSEYTLVRDSTITGPETDWSIAQNQWYVYAQNTSNYLGYHRMESVITGVKTISKNNNFSVYPNPGDGKIYVKTGKETDIVITNSLGEVIVNTHSNDTDFEISISEYPSGVYYIKASEEFLKYIKL